MENKKSNIGPKSRSSSSMYFSDFYSIQLQTLVFTKLDVSPFRESCQDSAGKTTLNEKEHRRRGTKPQH